jgi:uncharacterized protein
MLPLWSLLLAIGVEEVPNPRQQNSWISDTADTIPAESEARLNALLGRINQQTKAEIAVVTVDDVDGTPKQFATALFNHWGVGSAERNDGVLFVMVMNERRLEVEVGYGLEPSLPDGWLGTMQTNSMVPRFKQSDFAGGLEVGVIEVGKRLGATGLPSVSTVPAAAVQHAAGRVTYGPERSKPSKPILPWLLYGLGIGGGLGLLGGGIRGGRVLHHKRCRQCKVWRTVLDEVADDEHLDAGQQREEELRSIDYNVYVCPQCSSVSTMAKYAWFSGYSRCPSCSYRTMTTSSTTIRAATTSSEGEAKVTEDCHHCNHHAVSYRTIPRIQQSTSSSSGGSSFGGGGGGSSFGGGSSGGGGAGSSW